MSMHKASNISSIHETLVHLSYTVSAIFCLEAINSNRVDRQVNAWNLPLEIETSHYSPTAIDKEH